MEKQRLKQDLLIGLMCLFMILLIFLIVGCIFLHFRLISKDMPLKEELKSYAIQTHCVETRIVLSPSQTNQLTSSEWMAAQPPSQEPTAVESKVQSPTSPKPKPQRKRSISHIYQSNSSESIHLDETGSVYSLEHFQCLYSSSWSDSKESLMDWSSQDEEGGGSNESGSVVLCAIHQM
ncbi:uncharacterized protein PHA67_003574 [Liasis olivaceus]